MDEIVDYLLFKHRHAIGRGVCLLSGFALGAAPSLLPEASGLLKVACALVAAIVAMILMFRNDLPRDYHFEDPKENRRE